MNDKQNNGLAGKSKLDLWLTFLTTESDAQMEELKMADPDLAKAVAEVELATMEPEERRLYFSRVEELSDSKSDLLASTLQGKAEGLAFAITELCKTRFSLDTPLNADGLARFDDIQLSNVLKKLLLAQSGKEAERILSELAAVK